MGWSYRNYSEGMNFGVVHAYYLTDNVTIRLILKT